MARCCTGSGRAPLCWPPVAAVTSTPTRPIRPKPREKGWPWPGRQGLRSKTWNSSNSTPQLCMCPAHRAFSSQKLSGAKEEGSSMPADTALCPSWSAVTWPLATKSAELWCEACAPGAPTMWVWICVRFLYLRPNDAFPPSSIAAGNSGFNLWSHPCPWHPQPTTGWVASPPIRTPPPTCRVSMPSVKPPAQACMAPTGSPATP